MYQVWDKIHSCRRGLREWSKHSFGSIKLQIRTTEEKLKQAEANSMRGFDHHRVVELKRQLRGLFSKEERMWKQRSRTEWLKAGDSNTRFFHCRATQRKRCNHIYRIKKDDGAWTEAQDQVPPTFLEYYSNLFTSANPPQIEEVVENILPVVTPEMNRQLTRDFTSSEVDHAIKQMAPLTAPGPDGLPPVFYQHYWHLVGADVTQAVLSSLNSGRLLHAINHTHITLIPKIKNPESVTDYRPISLCNVLYKLAAKVLTNRLKGILSTIISESQSAFVPGRLITDNILVAFETLHHMHHQRKGKQGSMAIKLDMSKAYDRVEWRFLERVMHQMGFAPKWITLMTECISTVSYSILINGAPHGFIKPSRGLRQGDPLSPYLFLLCAEGLHSLIHKAKMKGELKGVSINRRGPKITHLFFAGDSLLFCKATTQDCDRIQEILHTYEQASGQQINLHKTTIFFSKSTLPSVQQTIQTKLAVPAIKHYEKYLGLPSFIGRAKYTTFAQIKERVWCKLKGWKTKLISQASREVLIKSVAQAIPSYAMSCFRLPTRLCSEIEVLIRKFWWGENGDKGKMHWIKWGDMCQSKTKGGMGFRELEKFNEALLGKQVWRLLHNHNSLFYKVFKAKFFPNSTIMEAQPKAKGSYAWKSIMRARDLIKKGMVWRIGDGSHVNIWTDNWLPVEHHHKVISPHPSGTHLAKVSDLIQTSSRRWNQQLVQSTFLPLDASAIMGIPLCERPQQDTLVWGGTQNGRYSVRSGYRLLMDESLKNNPGCSNNSQLAQLWKSIWTLFVPPKVRHFIWRACHESLPTRANLHRRHILDDERCETCKLSGETAIHAIWNCPSLGIVWSSMPWKGAMNGISFLSFLDLFQFITTNQPNHETELFAMICWSLWYHRNRKRLSQPTEPLDRLVVRAQELLSEYHSTHSPSLNPPPVVLPRPAWNPPEPGRYKVNFDGAVFENSGEAGIGVIIRNCNGEPMAALCQRIPYPHSVIAVEASAAKAATQLAIDVGIIEVEIEGDSLSVVTALLDPSPCLALFGQLIEDTKQLAQSLHFACFQHVKRAGNSVAHALAKKARNSKSLEIWLEFVPPDIFPILCKDFSLH